MYNATYTFSSPVFDTESLRMYAMTMNENLHGNA